MLEMNKTRFDICAFCTIGTIDSSENGTNLFSIRLIICSKCLLSKEMETNNVSCIILSRMSFINNFDNIRFRIAHEFLTGYFRRA